MPESHPRTLRIENPRLHFPAALFAVEGRQLLRRTSNSSRLHSPRHLPSSASSVIKRRGRGKLNGGASKLTERQPPVRMSSFSPTLTCVVASRKAEPLRLKL